MRRGFLLAFFGIGGIAVAMAAITPHARAQNPLPESTQPAQPQTTIPGHPEAQERQGPDATGRGTPIQGGHRLQPRRGDLGTPDVSEENAKKLDELYRKLMQSEHPPAGQKP